MIDYDIINQSCIFYENIGYTRIESPWMVSEYIDKLTRPKDKIPFKIEYNQKCLVASGEQSFLYLYLKDYLPLGKYQTVTPCFRHEFFDITHSNCFIKNELINTINVNESELLLMVTEAESFFSKYFETLTVEATKIGYDILYNGYELGSYGIRSNEFLTYIYGTGVAEPRLSTIKNKIYGLS